MIKHLLFSTGLVLVFSFNLISQNNKTAATYQAVDPKAKSILDQVSAKTKAYKSIEAEFGIVVESKQEKTKDSKKGKIWIKGNKYKADLAASNIFNDGKTQWTYMKDANEVNITTPDPNDDSSLNPAKMFTIYEKGYKIKYIGEKFENARALYEIELYPIDLKKDFTKITLKIDKTKMQIFSMKRFGKDGTDYLIEVIKMETDKEMADAMFTFDKTKYPKVEVNDMRE
ncbi:MAG: outer membrane lipoprotein carrier protein LolA [Bacteroidia bacterium]|nr:outer membrane lipoprotein carrier protein LolA [Bacteroidia bacterium]